VGEIGNLFMAEKRKIFRQLVEDNPLGLDKFVASCENSDWSKAGMAFDTYGNILCPHKRTIAYPAQSDIPPYFHTCSYQSVENSGCQGKLDIVCQNTVQQVQHTWNLLFYALIYINYPANVIIQESEKMTVKERKMHEKQKKLNAINPKKPRLRVVPRDVIIKWKQSQQKGTHASPIPHLRSGHWRKLKHERFKKRGEFIWVKDTTVGGELTWEHQNTFYRVIEPPSRKYER